VNKKLVRGAHLILRRRKGRKNLGRRKRM